MLLMLAALVASVVAVVLASPTQAATFTVTTAADEQNTNGQCSLREAMINSNQNDQSGSTDCAAGVGEDTINFNLGSTATITLGSPLPVINGFHPAGLIIDGGSADITISGDNKYRVFEVAFDPATLSNLTVANGANATFEEGGGGIYNRGGTLTVSNSTISGNSTANFADGGGILNSGTVTVSNSTISGNSSRSDGGGIYNLGGTVTVRNSTLSDNSASSYGGGINNNALGTFGTLTVSNSTLSGNSATSGGGGIANMSGTATVRNSTLSGNSAPDGEGGGILFRAVTGTVGNSTISGNSASFGGGIRKSGGTRPTFKNTIVAANDASVIAPDVGNSFTSQGHNLIGNNEGSSGFTNGQNGDLVGTATNPIDPMLGPLANNGGPTLTHALLEGSPAIDKGNSFGATTDQRGQPRPHDFASIANATGGDASDIGSFEVQPAPNEAPTVAVAQGGACGTTDMRGTINLALAAPDDSPQNLTLSATSSNQGVVPNRNISFGGGTDASRTMTVTSLMASGTSTVTVTVSDGDLDDSVEVRVIAGSAANNTLTGSAAADMIFARKGNDTASGQGANDLLCGGNGNDKLRGGLGADRFGGGTGTDTATDFNAGQGDTKGGIP